LIVTAISKPKRLFEYLPKNYPIISFGDHSYFDIDLITKKLQKQNAKYILTTSKDLVKLPISHFHEFKIILMDLNIILNDEKRLKIEKMI
jgi:tetraacyldisaccharide 4'-kinase